MNKRRVFIPTESVTIAHVVRPLQVAKVLRQKGVEVIFGANGRYRSLIEKEGFDVRALYCADPAILLDAVRRLDFTKQFACIPDYLESDITVIQSIPGVDMILSDCRFTARLAADRLKIPHVAIANGIHSPYYDVLLDIPQTISFHWPSWIRKNRILRRFLSMTLPRYQALPYKRLCRRDKLDTKIEFGFDIFLSDTLTLLCDLPEFAPQKALPDHYQFVGPILWEQDGDTQPIPRQFDGKRRPLLYITFGTSGETALLHRIITSLHGLPYDIVISMAPQNLGKLPENIFAAPFVGVSEVLKKASLLICHGGSGTIYQAISHAVPILCIPTFYDQEWNGERVKELGLGDCIFYRRLDAHSLQTTIARLIGDAKIKENMKRFQSSMGRWNGPELAAQKIMAILARS